MTATVTLVGWTITDVRTAGKLGWQTQALVC